MIIQNTVDKGAIFCPRYSIFDTLGRVPTNNHHFSHSPGKKTLTDSFQHPIAPGSGQYYPPQGTADGSPVKSNNSEQNY